MVEILMSTYNGEKWMDEQIESIVNQTYKDWLLLVRDDGSSDNTVKKLYEWKERLGKKMRIIEGKNVGVTKSFEILLKENETQYCMMCDQDDYWKREKVELSMQQMMDEERKHPDQPVVVFTAVDLVDGDLKPLGKTFFEQNQFDFPFAKRFKNICVCNCVAGCTMLINWRAKQLVLPFSEKVPMHDWWIAAKVAKNGILSVVETPTMLYRQHGDNVCGAKKAENGYYERLAKNPKALWDKYSEVAGFLRDVGFRGGFVAWLFYKLRHIIHRKCA